MLSNELIFLSSQAFVMVALVGVAYCLGQKPEVQPKVETPASPKFSDSYPLDNSAETVAETEANLASQQVEDDVPDSGRVVLRRVAVGEFDYWADRSVAFANLEALARKWSLVFREPAAYVQRRRVLETRPAVQREPDSVFAPLKTYAATTVVKEEHCNLYRWRGRVREVPCPKDEKEKENTRSLRYSDFKKNV